MAHQQQRWLRLSDPRPDQLPLFQLSELPDRYILERWCDNELHPPYADAASVDIAMRRARLGADSFPVGFVSLPKHQFSCATIAHQPTSAA